MKRQIVVLFLLLTFLLSACTPESTPTVNTVTLNGEAYTVDSQQGTITHGEDVYLIMVEVGTINRTTKILYPNGATYYYTESETGGHGGWSEDYDPDRYVDGDTLLAVLEMDVPKPTQRQGHPLLGLLLILVGLVEAIFPQFGWYLRYGWAFKNGEPSDLALGLSRAGGVVMLIIGIIAMFV